MATILKAWRACKSVVLCNVGTVPTTLLSVRFVTPHGIHDFAVAGTLLRPNDRYMVTPLFCKNAEATSGVFVVEYQAGVRRGERDVFASALELSR